MLCERCQKRKANVLYTEIINGAKKEENLCEQCANSSPSFHIGGQIFDSEYSIGGFLSNLLQGYTKSGPTMANESVAEVTCSKCNLSNREFLQKGRFGCSQCYTDFNEEINKSLRGIQGAEVHTGKGPGKKAQEVAEVQEDSSSQALTEVEQLSMNLQEAIKKEEYEEAARLRDLIREMKKEDNSHA